MGNMPLIATTLVLLIVLIVLVIIYISRQKSRQSAPQSTMADVPKEPKAAEKTFEQLLAVLKDKSSSAAQLAEAAGKIVELYGVIPKKIGSRPHPDFEHYQMAIVRLCRHPRINKDIIVSFDKALAAKNPEYATEIELSLKQGLSSRG